MTDAARPLVCMEIWGGNRAVDRAVSTPGLDVWVSSRPHAGAEAGGDVYYASLCGGGTITRLLLADVAGHGAGVADLAAALRGLMRANINRPDQTRLVRALNRAFAARAADSGRFATAVVATYLTAGDTLTVSTAGHPRPLWYRAGAGGWDVLAAAPDDGGRVPGDLPLGITAEADYSAARVNLARGDLVLFYTDALTEAEDPAGRPLGEAGLLALLGRFDPADPAAIPAALTAALDDYRGGRPADDDATFVLIRHTAGPARRPGLRESLGVYAKLLGLRPV